MNIENILSDEPCSKEDFCAFCFVPFYVVAQHLNRNRKAVALDELDAFFLDFENIVSSHFDLPTKAFDLYRRGRLEGVHSEEINMLALAIPAPNVVIAAMCKILTGQTREHMMLVATALNEDVFSRVKENVQLQKHPIFASNP